MSKKIVIVTGFFYPNIGGMEKQIDLWAHTLSHYDCEVTIYTNALFHAPGVVAYDKNIKLIREGSSLSSWSQKAVSWVADNCDGDTIIIIASLGKDVMPGMLGVLKSGQSVGSRVVLNIPTSDHVDRAMNYKGAKEFMNKVDRIISVSLRTAHSLALKYKNVYYVPNYLSQEEIKKAQTLKLPSKKSIAYFGRISARKRVDLLPIIAKKLHPVDYTVFVQGPAGYGEERLYHSIKKDLIAAGGVMIQPSSEPDLRVADSIIFINPSEVEGLSIALLEAMNRGNIPILSNIPENAIVVENSSLLCENKPTEYVEVIKRILSMPKNDIIALQMSMRKTVIANYSENSIRHTLFEAIIG
jgi:glycosyltransferase involved in cell wall biosynthesis